MFNPKKSFFELPVVRWAIGIHVVIASASALAILITGDYGFSPTADGFNLFLTDFKFPIGVLAMLIPVVALLATNHRSEQTKEQIRVAESQNIFSNYYKHREEYESFASRLELDPEDFDSIRFYNFVFSNSVNGHYGVSQKAYDAVDDLCFRLMNSISKLLDKRDDSIFEESDELFFSATIVLSRDFGIHNKKRLWDYDYKIYGLEFSDKEIKIFKSYLDIQYSIDQLDKALGFDVGYKRPDHLVDVMCFDIATRYAELAREDELSY